MQKSIRGYVIQNATSSCGGGGGVEQQSVWRPHYQVWQNFLWWNFFFGKTRVFLLHLHVYGTASTLSFCVLRVSMDVWIFHSDPVEGNAQLPPDQALAWAVRQQEYRCQNGQRRRWSRLQQELCPPETRARLATGLEGEEDIYSALVRDWELGSDLSDVIFFKPCFRTFNRRWGRTCWGSTCLTLNMMTSFECWVLSRGQCKQLCGENVGTACTVCFGWKNVDPVVSS